MDINKITTGVKLILEGIGEDINRAGLKDTPRRVAEMYQEIFAGLKDNPDKIIKPIKDEKHDEMVIIKDIPFHSMCEHHLLPFIGKAHIAYIPANGRIVGISTLAKALEILASRPQIQERLTSQFVDSIMKNLTPKGAMVIIESEHLCMSMRGVKKPNSITVTSAVRGVFRTNASTRSEMLSLIKK